MRKSSFILFFLILTFSVVITMAGDIKTELLAAIQAGNQKEVDRLIDRGDIYVAKKDCGRKALLFCAKTGDESAVKKLLKAGTDINAQGKGEEKGWTALTIAIQNNRDNVATFLIQRGADLTLRPKKGEYRGWYPLQLAIRNKNLKLVRELLNHGAKIDVREKTRKMTPLMIAALTGDETLTTLLLEKGANVALKDKKGWTPLIHAVESASYPCVIALVKAGANVNALDKDYLSVLQHASAQATRLRKQKKGPENFEKIVPYLKAHGAIMVPVL